MTKAYAWPTSKVVLQSLHAPFACRCAAWWTEYELSVVAISRGIWPLVDCLMHMSEAENKATCESAHCMRRLISPPSLLCSSDIIPVILILVLGISNGHLASLASMHMPSLLPSTYR